jgi:hypothetical protein
MFFGYARIKGSGKYSREGLEEILERLDLSEARDAQRESLPAAHLKGEKTEHFLPPVSDMDQTINDVLAEEEVAERELYFDIEDLDNMLSKYIGDYTEGQKEGSSASASELWAAEGLCSFLCSNRISYFSIETKDGQVFQAPWSFLTGLFAYLRLNP